MAATTSVDENASTKEVCVFLMNQNGLCLPVRSESKKVTTREIVNALRGQLLQGVNFKEQRPTYLANDSADGQLRFSEGFFRVLPENVFALWMSSPLLELQLMTNQHPFKILANWSHLLTKYAVADREAIEADEPVLSFQRNVFLTKAEERELEDGNVLELLYEEAKVNILDGRYPCEDYEQFAALQAAIELDPRHSEHSVEFFRVNGHRFLPLHYRVGGNETKAHWFASSRRGRSSPYLRIMERYKELTQQNTPRVILIRTYLEKCWEFDFYGSAFFSGQMEKATRGVGLLVNHYDKKVWVAINEYGLHVVDKKLCKLLFSLHYEEFKWQVAHPSDESNPNSFKCLFVQITYKPENNGAYSCEERECKLIQIFSKQASLVANLITEFTSKLPERDVPDNGSFRADLITNTRPVEASTIKRLSKTKLSSTTFDSHGVCIKHEGSFRVVHSP